MDENNHDGLRVWPKTWRCGTDVWTTSWDSLLSTWGRVELQIQVIILCRFITSSQPFDIVMWYSDLIEILIKAALSVTFMCKSRINPLVETVKSLRNVNMKRGLHSAGFYLEVLHWCTDGSRRWMLGMLSVHIILPLLDIQGKLPKFVVCAVAVLPEMTFQAAAKDSTKLVLRYLNAPKLISSPTLEFPSTPKGILGVSVVARREDVSADQWRWS